MELNILFFGQLTEITGTSNLMVVDVIDTDHLLSYLLQKYPVLTNQKFVIAVDKKVITENTILLPNSTIALLPAFSGG